MLVFFLCIIDSSENSYQLEFFQLFQIFDLWPQLFPSNLLPLVCPQANVRSTQITNCAVADYTTITEKTSLKNCVLGTNTTVNQKTRISNSVLMNGITIEEGFVEIPFIYSFRILNFFFIIPFFTFLLVFS